MTQRQRQAIVKLYQAAKARVWWAVYAAGVRVRILAPEECPRCRRGYLLAVYRFGAEARGFTWWGYGCDECGCELGAPGFRVRARAVRERFRREVLRARQVPAA